MNIKIKCSRKGFWGFAPGIQVAAVGIKMDCRVNLSSAAGGATWSTNATGDYHAQALSCCSHWQCQYSDQYSSTLDIIHWQAWFATTGVV